MEKLLEVKNLCVNFGTYGGEVKAVRGVTFDLHKGETLAIVGESGSGKSVACKTIMRILSSNGYIKDGQILFDGKDLTKISEKDMEKVRGEDIAMIFQDPMTSLNPTMTIGKQIMEPIIKHQGFSKEDARKRAIELIELVGISDILFPRRQNEDTAVACIQSPVVIPGNIGVQQNGFILRQNADNGNSRVGTVA